MKKSRTEYSARNTIVAIVSKVCAILVGFLTRIVFINTISQSYVGVNGLFLDILKALAFSDMGIDTAISYALYRPIAEGNIEKQKSLMRLFRYICWIVAFFVFILGILAIPFIDVLAKKEQGINQLILIYMLYLTNSVLSYFMVYKKILIVAHELLYITIMYETGTVIVQYLLQIIILFHTRNFILFVSMMSLCTVINNIAISRKADKLYPYLRDKKVQSLSYAEQKKLYRNIWAMLLHKLGSILVNNTDNLLLSSIVGIISNSLYSNYYLIIGSISQILHQLFRGIIASVGNLGVKNDDNYIKRIFEASFFVQQWVFGMLTICMFEAIDIFVEICFGENYIFSKDITLILCLNFYFTGMRQAVLVFRDSMGLFWYDRYKSLAEAFVNLTTSVILGIYLGTLGIFLGTLISTMTTSLWIEPYVLYKYRLKCSPKLYFIRYGFYTFITFILWFAEDYLCRRFIGGLWMMCIKRIAFCIFITNLIYLLLYYHTKEFKLLLEKGRMILSHNTKYRK